MVTRLTVAAAGGATVDDMSARPNSTKAKRAVMTWKPTASRPLVFPGFKHAPQGRLEFAPRRQTLESGADHPSAVHHEDPRLGAEVPLLHRGRKLLEGPGLPDLLVDEDDSIAIGRDQRAHDVHDRAAHPTGTVPRRREHDHLRLALRDRVRDPRLMQPRIRRLAGIDLFQVADVAGDEVPTARSRRPDHRRERRRQGADAQPRRLDGAVAQLREDLEAPGAGAWKGHLRDVDALHVCRVAVRVPRAVGVDVDPFALL